MTNFQKLQKLLEELFQLDQADLDFGIYRIMNQKRDEVVRFLEKDLLPQVKEAFSYYQSADKSQIQRELDKLTQQIEAAGMNPNDSPKVQELKAQMADSSVDVTALENEVFSHLFNFFRRYHHEGDFISLRQSRLATTLDEQNELQQKLRDLEKKQRKQRQQIFEVEDEIAEKRDDLIDGLQQRMTQKTHSTHLFTIQWEVI